MEFEERRKQPRPQLLLVADDHDDLRDMWRSWLGLWGFATIEARHGAEAVEKAGSARPALVLMDFSMPVLDGLAALRLLRNSEATASIPVIGITAHRSVTARARDFARECDALLWKPADLDELLDEIRRVLRRESDRSVVS
jgi:CheY-like chemotaxis protein